MAQRYRCRPSEILNIPEEYDAFCFDEACAYISSRIEDGETPVFRKSFHSFSDMYKDLERRGTKCR
nr:MAG TPA: hypothetical protein [Caudoviricetes sp.]